METRRWRKTSWRLKNCETRHIGWDLFSEMWVGTPCFERWQRFFFPFRRPPPLLWPLLFLSPLCPAKLGLVQLFSPLFGLTESKIVLHIVLSSISQFRGIFLWKTKFMAVILGTRMWFLLRSIWPQVASSTKGVPWCCNLWVSPEHSLVPPALSQRMPVLARSQPAL